MQVILLERVEKLGQMGQVVMVKPGYARNFLLPRKKAIRATGSNLAIFENKKAQLQADNLKQKQEAQYVADNMAGLSVVIIRQASEVGHLYGSVRNRDIAELVTNAGFSIDKSQVYIPQAIKSLGLHCIQVNIHPEVSVEVKIKGCPIDGRSCSGRGKCHC
jgi:large subunit ribosomal protein L9